MKTRIALFWKAKDLRPWVWLRTFRGYREQYRLLDKMLGNTEAPK